ncbi:hypothetical protein [Paludibaculum fermentans]|uniref:hypothetical protein n=1 Tax=Paludibaculum fermentans TaxID=1473598 RepID=UPI003EB718AF
MQWKPWLVTTLALGLSCAAFGAVPAGAARDSGNESEPLAMLFDSELASGLALADTVPGSTGVVLPQLAFGGGWYTAMYFSNSTNTPATVTVNFFAGDGSALTVPLVGLGPVASQSVTLNANGTTVLEAPNTGGLLQGWAEAILPPGVTGYGVFRQSVSGLPDQEAVSPLSDETKQVANLTWDETSFVTGVAAVNPSGSSTTVSVSVYGDDGSVIGTSSFDLPAHGKTAFALRDLPGLAGITARRGYAKFSVANGAVSVLGLRFNGSAFTSIPVTYP